MKSSAAWAPPILGSAALIALYTTRMYGMVLVERATLFHCARALLVANLSQGRAKPIHDLQV
jgi:hypothetical protein